MFDSETERDLLSIDINLILNTNSLSDMRESYIFAASRLNFIFTMRYKEVLDTQVEKERQQLISKYTEADISAMVKRSVEK